MLKRSLLIGLAVIGLSDVAAKAVIVLGGTGGSGRNTVRPADLAGGLAWDLQGDYGSYLGTPIAPNWFITANHFGTVDTKLTTVDGVQHFVDPATGSTVQIPGTDLILRRVVQPFTNYAAIYNPTTDGVIAPTDTITVLGRGRARGAVYPTAGTPQGWIWGANDTVRSYGTNTISGLAVVSQNDVDNGSPFAVGTTFLESNFDNNGDPNEGTLAEGDSGGGVFVYKNGQYRLVRINYGVDLFRESATATTDLLAAIYDARGLYEPTDINDVNVPITGAAPVPQMWDASYVPNSLNFIAATVPEPTVLGGLAVGALLLGRRRAGR